MLKKRSSASSPFLHSAAGVMSLRPSPTYRGGRNQWRPRAFSNRPITDNGNNNNNDGIPPDYNPQPPPPPPQHYNPRPNFNPPYNHNQSFHPPPQYSYPYRQFPPPPLYNQNQQFQPQPRQHFRPNQQFRPPPVYNQPPNVERNQQFQQQQPRPYFRPNQQYRPPPFYNQPPNVEWNQQFRPPPYYQNQQLSQGQFRPQQRFRPPPSEPVPDYRIWEQAKPGPPPGSERFKVLSYNILADYLANNHRSRLYSHIPQHFLDWEFRKKSILFELGLWSPDILCFQEVDRFQDFEQELKARGFSGIWKMRTGEPVDGCAIFWRASRFKLLREEAIEFSKFGLRDNVAQICVLESLSEKSSAGSPPPAACSVGHNKVVICNIHVLYNPRRGEIKLGQVRLLLEKAYATSKLWDDAPVVLCGDYNSTPKSPLYNFISEQKLNVSELPRDKISGQYSAEVRPKRPFTSNIRIPSIDNATQSPARVDDKGESSSSLLTDTTHKEEKNGLQLETKEESEANSVYCTLEVMEKITSDVITSDSNPDELLEAIEDQSPVRVDDKGESSSSLLTDTTHKEEKTVLQLETKEESEANSVYCTSEVMEKITSDAITSDSNPDELLEAIEDQSPTRVDDKGESSFTLLTDTTHKDEKTVLQLETKEESEGNSVNCTSEVTENIFSDEITSDSNLDELLEAIEDVPVGEDSTSFLSELHGLDGADMADEADVADGVDVVYGEPFVENQNPFYDPSGWTPMEIAAATGSSECMTMEHHLKLRSTYTEVEDNSGARDTTGEPQVTSYHRGFQGTVDYIWRSEGLQTVRVLAPIPKRAMEWTPGYPTRKWGSDHIALVAELAFNKLDDEKSHVE